MKRVLLILAAVLLASVRAASPAAAQTSTCQFILGFQTLHTAIPSVTGDCLENQAFAANGDAQQHTTAGLMVWRKADNFTAFTDGYRSWVNGPYGVQQRLNSQRFPWETGTGTHQPPSAAALAPSNPGVQTVATGLAVPWEIDFAPDGRAFITERAGQVRIIQGGVLLPQPWATLPASSASGSERGLLGLALDPAFASNGYVYLYYTYNGAGGLTNRIVRMRDVNGNGVLDKVLIDGIPGGTIHDGGRLKFGPDGKLWATTGEAGDTSNSQNLASLGGKILRLGSDGRVPMDNPIPGSYVYSYGHRNVEGIAWHPDGGLYATEHGPSSAPPFCCHDEVNLIDGGVNYGWPTVYGIAGDARFRDPLLESGAGSTWAPTGAAFISDGPLRGSLLFGGLQDGSLHRVVFAQDGRTLAFQERLFAGQFGRLRDVVAGPGGAFYLLTSNRDGRGSPSAADDRLLKVTFA